MSPRSTRSPICRPFFSFPPGSLEANPISFLQAGLLGRYPRNFGLTLLLHVLDHCAVLFVGEGQSPSFLANRIVLDLLPTVALEKLFLEIHGGRICTEQASLCAL